MRSCNSVRLSAYLDRALSRRARQNIEDHLLTCDACADELEAMRRSTRVLKTLPRQSLSPASLKKLHDAIDAEATDRAIWRLGWRIGAIAASILIVASVWLAEQPPPPPVRSAIASTPDEAWAQLATTLCIGGITGDDAVQVAFTTWMFESLFGDTDEGNGAS